MSTSDGSKWTAIVRKPNKGEPEGCAMVRIPGGKTCACFVGSGATPKESAANATLAASAPDLLAACEVFEEWLRREDEGFPNAGVVRETPEGEAAWRVWWDENCTLCAKAQTLARAAISRARGLA